VEHFRAKLLGKRSELTAAIARAEQDVRTASAAEVGDPIDRAVDDTAADEALQSGTTDSETLAQVDEALRRLNEGTYGKCVICGKTIEAARLEAIPWTPYCLADQKKLEKAKGPTAEPTL
jgi:DnaK suppressor protein